MKPLRITGALLSVGLMAAGFAIVMHLVTGVPYWLTVAAAGAAAGAFIAAWFTRAKPEPLPELKPAETVLLMRRPPGAGFIPFADARRLPKQPHTSGQHPAADPLEAAMLRAISTSGDADLYRGLS